MIPNGSSEEDMVDENLPEPLSPLHAFFEYLDIKIFYKILICFL
jgi:hypothetical protein